MVSQTKNYLQFHTVIITVILGSTLFVRYLTTNEVDNIPIGSQVKLLDQKGWGNKRTKITRNTITVTSRGDKNKR